MTTITSKRHPLKFYGALAIFYMIGLMPLYGILYIIFLKPVELGIFIFLLGIVFSVICWLLISNYIKYSPKITIDMNTIKIGYRSYEHNERKEIKLTGKRKLGSISAESGIIEFNNGTKLVLFDRLYSNISEIKLFLEQVVINKEEYKPKRIETIPRNAIRFEKEEKFKIFPLLSFESIVYWSFMVILISALLTNKNYNSLNIQSVIYISVIFLLFFLQFSWRMYYFGLTKNHLIIRNHHYLWTKKIYQLSDIKEIIFEPSVYIARPNSMRIITIDYTTKLFPASTLRDKTWLKLKREFEQKGIKVRNEAFF